MILKLNKNVAQKYFPPLPVGQGSHIISIALLTYRKAAAMSIAIDNKDKNLARATQKLFDTLLKPVHSPDKNRGAQNC